MLRQFNTESAVYAKLPKAGLGNMLLTWSRAFVFAALNDLDMHTSSWATIHYGAWIRREKRKRLYAGYFKKAAFTKTLRFLYYLYSRKKIIEPPVIKMNTIEPDKIFVFNKIFTDYDFFKEVRPYKEIVKKGLFELLHPALQNEYNNSEKPIIGLHIRRGDFKKKSTLTPTSFFVDVINTLREQSGSELPVTIFTDAESHEIAEVTKLNNIKIANNNADILDILLLASSKIAVLSVGSTFSYWAAFLSDGTIIKNDIEWHTPFRAASDKSYLKEIVWNKDLKFRVDN